MTTVTAPATQQQRTLPATVGAIFRDPETPKKIAGATGRSVEWCAQLMRSNAATFRANPPLRACSPESVMVALMDQANYGLLPGPAGHIWLIARRSKQTGTVECHAEPGWRGLVQIGVRESVISGVDGAPVYSKDRYRRWFDGGSHIEHEPFTGPDRGDLVGAWCRAYLPNGSYRDESLTRADIAAIRARADPGSKAWRDFPGEMALKSCVKRLLKKLTAGAVGPQLLTHALDAGDAAEALPVIEWGQLEEPPAPAKLEQAVVAPTFAEIATAAKRARLPDDLDAALSAIGHLPPDQQAELRQLISDRRAELQTGVATTDL